MSFISACHFIRSRGVDRLYHFLDLCRRGATVGEIGREFGISASLAARLRKKYFIVEYRLRPSVVEAIELHVGIATDIDDERRARLAALQEDRPPR